MGQANGISIMLTQAQITSIMREGGSRASSLLGSLEDLSAAADLIDGASAKAAVSRSTLRALLVLAAYPADGSYRALADVAREVGYNASTTHRYTSTWLAVGLLEQDPRSRRYRRIPSAGAVVMESAA